MLKATNLGNCSRRKAGWIWLLAIDTDQLPDKMAPGMLILTQQFHLLYLNKVLFYQRRETGKHRTASKRPSFGFLEIFSLLMSAFILTTICSRVLNISFQSSAIFFFLCLSFFFVSTQRSFWFISCSVSPLKQTFHCFYSSYIFNTSYFHHISRRF